MSKGQGLTSNQMGPPFREKMRVLLEGGPIGAWVMIEPGSITIEPDTVGTYKARRTGVIVQHEPGLVVIRRTLLPALFHSHLIVVRGSTPASVNVTVGVQITTGEWKRIGSILAAAGFVVGTVDTKYSAAAELRRFAT
ncbi:MAG: hypothetical protein QOJ62_1019 [Actinomycetota bacterium]|nr:hypothetical protein [Actinomycetota bacterium]